MRVFQHFWSYGIAVVALQLAVPLESLAQAQQRERAGIMVGAFLTNRDTETRLDSNLGPGTDLDLEGDLGLESTTNVGRLNGYVWISPRQRFDFAYFDLSRSASRRIQERIDFGDLTFEINTTIDTEFDLSIVKTDYTFAPVSRERGYLGLTAGLYTAATKIALSERTLGRAESEDLTAPLPVVGLRGEIAVTDRLTIGGASQWFALDVGDASGRLRDFYIGADYRLGERFGVGLAYNDVSMNLTAEESGGFVGRLDWGYDGWLLYLKAELGRR